MNEELTEEQLEILQKKLKDFYDKILSNILTQPTLHKEVYEKSKEYKWYYDECLTEEARKKLEKARSMISVSNGLVGFRDTLAGLELAGIPLIIDAIWKKKKKSQLEQLIESDYFKSYITLYGQLTLADKEEKEGE